ncbi:uncharacterized protein LOC113322698 isoform X1 [Papaver somniferum]|uniref:uncharacterized protein LOC113322698 isoform X1 n=1 Tax=Papaver somniferum TaxID=3469 RepID=UPI000E6F775B|nr:uncharacterized protein LOC113322698 isoform X1 [Papaver somniferum]
MRLPWNSFRLNRPSSYSLSLSLNSIKLGFLYRRRKTMTAAKIIGAVVGTTVLAFGLDHVISDRKLFGGTTPSTVSNQAWWQETDKKFQSWPRVAGPPVVMNPISRQNFIVKSRDE